MVKNTQGKTLKPALAGSLSKVQAYIGNGRKFCLKICQKNNIVFGTNNLLSLRMPALPVFEGGGPDAGKEFLPGKKGKRVRRGNFFEEPGRTSTIYNATSW